MDNSLTVIGWREWVSLPDLSIHRLRTKIDTGAKTSSLHAEDSDVYESDAGLRVRFRVRTAHHRYACDAPVVDRRTVRSSNGQSEDRPVIRVDCRLGEIVWPIELTLTDRTPMRFPMLLGRRAMENRFLVNPGASYTQPKPVRRR